MPAEANTHVATKILGTAPADYYDSFLRTGEAGAIEDALARELARSTGLRNRIVHEYGSVDHSVVHAAIPQAVDRFQRYVRQLSQWLQAHR